MTATMPAMGTVVAGWGATVTSATGSSFLLVVRGRDAWSLARWASRSRSMWSERRLVGELAGVRLGRAAVGALGLGGRPAQARGHLVGLDLDDRAGLALGGLPGALP